MRKTFLSVFLFLLVCFGSFSLEAQNHPVFISLGRWCIPAQFLKYYHLRERSYPFDWLITGNRFINLYQVLKDDFKYFGLKENLAIDPQNPQFVIDHKTGFWFAHDFPIIDRVSHHISPTFLEAYEAVIDKYQRRIQRFRETLLSGRPIIFIRIDLEGQGTKGQAILLKNLLSSQYPQSNFTFIQLGFTEEHKSPWNLERIYNYYIDESTATQYESREWKIVLKGIEDITQSFMQTGK